MASKIKTVQTFVLLSFLRNCSCLILKLNDSQYARMPPLNALEPWDTCVTKPIWLYCIADFSLTSDQPSDLLDMIHEYSAATLHHYNHSQIHRGICVTDTCKDLLKEYTFNETLDLNGTLEACQNRTIWRDYELQANLEQVQYCKSSDDKNNLDTSDFVMLIIYFILIGINTVGTMYDRFIKGGKGNKYLLAFSIPRNWIRLTASADHVPDPRLLNFKSFNGFRALVMICVFFAHIGLLLSSNYSENTAILETDGSDISNHILYGGTLVTHTFFLMSGVLVSYNFQLQAEKRKFTWFDLPRGLLLRWLRLTPLYAFILGSVATLIRHMGNGPLWDMTVLEESNLCRKYWWSNLLYFNNYIRDNNCLPQAWYIACDMQLFGLGLFICLMARTPRLQKLILSVTMVVSVIIVGAVTYFLNLDAVVMSVPEKSRDLFVKDDTFRLMFIPGHTNISVYTMGLATGFIIYYCQQKNIDFSKYRRYSCLFLLVLPLSISIMLTHAMFYARDYPLIVKALYASLHKVVYQLITALFIFGMVFKIETIQARVLEWKGFTWPARVTFATFLLHNIVQRPFLALRRHPIYISNYETIMMLLSSLFLTFVISAVLWLTLENPISTIVKLVTKPSRPTKSTKEGQDMPSSNRNV